MIDAISAGCRTASIRSRKRSLEDTETHPENQAKNNQKMRSMRRLERHLIIKVIIEIGRRSTLIPLRPATARPGFSRPRRAVQQPQLGGKAVQRSEEHQSELPSLMRISYAVFSLTQTTNHYY